MSWFVLKLSYLTTPHNPLSLCIYENTVNTETHSGLPFGQEFEAWVDPLGFSI